MKNLKRFMALGLASAMAVSTVACGSNASTEAGSDTASASVSAGGEMSDIKIGTWWVQYYDSDDADISVSPDYQTNQPSDGDDEETARQKALGLQICQLKWDNKDEIEEKYGITFEWVNLTYDGVRESINTSILAGSPDCDIYLVDTTMAVPAQVNGLAINLKDVLPADADVFTDQNVVSYLDLGDDKVCILKRVEAQSMVEATYPLGFNMQMLAEYNLEDPRELYARGEWTWDKFIEYCQTLTKDTDGDGQIDQYGYTGYAIETFEQLMMSNGANVASGKAEQLSSAPTGEALQMMYDMYNTYNVCAPYSEDYNENRNGYTKGNVGFFPIAAWITSGNNDYDFDGTVGYTLPFDIAYVQWPTGPSGNSATNAGKNATAGEYYIIPAGVENPVTVYNFLYDYWNWYKDDTSIRDDRGTLNWWYGVTASKPELQEANFNVMNDVGSRTTFDLWGSMNIEYDWNSFIAGEMTPAQFQETYKQQVQDGLDKYFN